MVSETCQQQQLLPRESFRCLTHTPPRLLCCCSGLHLLCVLSCLPQAPYMDAVIKVYCVHTEPNYSLPWQVRHTAAQL